jgi:hypothetical protein
MLKKRHDTGVKRRETHEVFLKPARKKLNYSFFLLVCINSCRKD